ncbi:serine/threonine-protein kinase [Sphingopyxis sp. KK2]|uniref:serine/threonine-protein kinase n=1 Tax=Sphingopyxis sp. KK2 TaxID=1855727 RepID=UPI00097E682C|nr:serine/threonine-protein kinase [Sphingopyxis sp. KK2]
MTVHLPLPKIEQDRSAVKNVGRYQVISRLGEGAMADVYRAVDPGIGREVAIKVLKPEYARNEALNLRFLREARAAGALSHPNIATIYEVGEDGGGAFIAMELVEGQPLDTILQANGRMPYERVLQLGQQLAAALAYAHRAGVVHRDVKPSNILLSSDGRTAKLVDFGVARIDDPACGGDGAELERTQFGQMIGTPRYMSPEQALSLPVDHRSDLFSLGIVLYEMVTGKVAFPGIGLGTVAIQIAQERVESIEKSAADCPPGLRFVIDKLLAKKPNQRFADGEAVRSALQREMAAREDTAVTRRGLSLRLKLPILLVSVTLAVLALCGSMILSREGRAFEEMAVASGQTVAAFVASNAGVTAVDNATLPPDQQDWSAVQAFVESASEDREIRSIAVIDARGVVRASTNAVELGKRYAAVSGRAIQTRADTAVSYRGAQLGDGMRFVRAIRYAGGNYGQVDIVIRTDALAAAKANTRFLLAALSLTVLLTVAAAGYFSGAAVTRPLGRLRGALDAAASARFALRISHRRRDEFGAAFDAFNKAAATAEAQFAERPQDLEASMIATRISGPEDAGPSIRQVA